MDKDEQMDQHVNPDVPGQSSAPDLVSRDAIFIDSMRHCQVAALKMSLV